MTARLGATVDAIDLFCGWGGSSQGIAAAGATLRLAANHSRLAIDIHARNFPDTDHLVADVSNPDAPRDADGNVVEYVDPMSLPPSRFMWASPSCRFHSPANAKKLYATGPNLFDDPEFDHDLYAKSERSRVSMLCPLRYAAKHAPELVIVENVVEAAKWGPDRDGSTFQWWLREWERVGYSWRAVFLNSMFFPPCPQSRDRMYVVFWRRGNPAPDLDYRPTAYCTRCEAARESRQTWKRRTKAWPLEQWGKYRTQYIYTCTTCAGEVEPLAWPAYSAIDWSDLGTRIGDRDRPLAPKTVERIRRGIAKFANHPAVVIPNITGGRARHIAAQLSTQVTTSRDMLITRGVTLPTAGNVSERPGQTRAKPLDVATYTQTQTQALGFAHVPTVATFRGGKHAQMDSSARAVTEPVGTMTAGGIHHSLTIAGGFTKINGGPGDTAWHNWDEALGTITARDTTGLIVLPWIDQYRSDPAAVSDQLATVMTHARHALASIEPGDPADVDVDDVRFRMLHPDPEIRRAMAFGDDYILAGNKTQMIAGLGNAVTPPVADWLTQQALATLNT